ncbi:hypothetical protein DASC09_050370 [Saccharomycopsis crataegensis]|uniref:Ribosome biogenesis protein SLX9 n=1 Tax=Saccharomycopsis crataegensis TaxID=43959 RepID=A0AAV5QT13_9ASCO|nr:hypothetical protein DASC09_050370 [Saccharomycopsis crataegensis]
MSNFKRREEEEEELDEMILAKEPLFFKKPKKKSKKSRENEEFKPVAFKSLRGNKFNFQKFNQDYILKQLDLVEDNSNDNSDHPENNNKEEKEEKDNDDDEDDDDDDEYPLTMFSNNKKQGRRKPIPSGKKREKRAENKGSAVHTLTTDEARIAASQPHQPFSEDRGKQARYKEYISSVLANDDVPVIFNSQERQEFDNITKMYSLLNRCMKDKFSSSDITASEPCSSGSQDLREVRDLQVSKVVRQRLGLEE